MATPFSIPNFAFKQSLWNGGAIDDHKGVFRPKGVIMNYFDKNFLAGSAGPKDQGVDGMPGYVQCRLCDRLHLTALAHKFRRAVFSLKETNRDLFCSPSFHAAISRALLFFSRAAMSSFCLSSRVSSFTSMRPKDSARLEIFLEGLHSLLRQITAE